MMIGNTSQEPTISDVDFVITWVDSSDPKWQRDFANHKSDTQAMGHFRDMGTLQYMFRSFELFTPWVRKIHFVTYGHIPSWLNTNHPKINIVRHEDIIPNDALPTFNDCAIELALGNIAGLSEKFVYFNDDTFMIKPTAEDRFFSGNLPKDFFQVRILFQDRLFSHLIHEHMSLVARTFQMKDVFTLRMIPKVFSLRYGIVANVRTFLSLMATKTLSCFVLYHHPQPHLKINIQEASREYSEDITRSLRQKFRSYDSICVYIFRFWGLINGRFIPYKVRDALYKTISTNADIDNAIEQARKRRYRFVCFNDAATLTEVEYSYFKQRVVDFLDEFLPETCSFELTDRSDQV